MRFKAAKNWTFTLSSLLLLLLFIYTLRPLESSPSVVVSLASDGLYILSSHSNGNVVLWDVKAKKGRIIAKNSNSHSAYFIKNGSNFLWQDAEANRIHVQNTEGSGIFSLHLDYAVNSVTMTTDLARLYASDIRGNLYSQQGEKPKILKKLRGLENSDKPLNIALSSNDKFLLVAGAELTSGVALSNKKTATTVVPSNAGIMLWNAEEELVSQFSGLAGKVVAAISPDNKYVVGGDEYGNAMVWDIALQKPLFKLQEAAFTVIQKQQHKAILAIKFIDLAGNYLCFFKHIPYVILYNINDPQPKKYFYLGHKAKFAINDYARNQTIDSAPAAQMLALGKSKAGGVALFHYDNQQQTLKKLWDTN